uniref:HTH psq-type domain-containing protein n=1 Tax=Molossus molossus TaxID=27622 RepID=A0A7J8BIW8_MOLMO|nr:hypothetical protein HJG59_010241 [Molossus molossus]
MIQRALQLSESIIHPCITIKITVRMDCRPMYSRTPGILQGQVHSLCVGNNFFPKMGCSETKPIRVCCALTGYPVLFLSWPLIGSASCKFISLIHTSKSLHIGSIFALAFAISENFYLSPTMAPKRATSSKPSDDETKCQRKMLTIYEKVKLLDMIKDGKKIVEVAHHYDLNESIVCSICEDEKNIRATATVSFNKEAKCIVTSCNKFLVKT